MSSAVRDSDRNQRAAADPASSVFVTANAGSGKTKVLVDRIARLLLAGSTPSAFLCITYTKAAAAEMQRRLFDRLGGWCVLSDADLAAALMALNGEKQLQPSPAMLTRARALFAQALETPGGLKIQTIHAFCERLLARFPLEAGVPPGFDIADEARAAALLGRARAEAALAEDAPQEAFRRFAARMDGESLEALLDRLALKRADFHRYTARHGGGVFAEAAIRNRHGARQSGDAFCRSFVAAQDWTALQRAAVALLEGGAQDQAAAQRLRAALVRRDGDARACTQACFAFAFNSNDEPYKKLVTAPLKQQYGWLEPALAGFVAACATARERLNAIERADDAAAALQLALKLDEAYERAKAQAGALDFDDLIEHAQALLQRSEAAPWVLYKLDGGIDHILVDEGQDTSPAQWDLIAPLQEEFFAGSGAREKVRTVFAVGDPKQSIYAFQGADPHRFLKEAQKLEKRARGAKSPFTAPDLRTSFRSAPEILRAVDATMSGKPLITALPGKHDEIVHRAAREREGGAVEVWPLARRPELKPAAPWDAPVDVETCASVHAVLAKAIAQRVQAMIAAGEAVWDKGVLRAMGPGDVLALVRTRGALFHELIKAFKSARMPVAGADRMTLKDELAVEDCLALMRVALDPADDLSLACVLKGPWCNLDDDDADLFPLAYGRGRETLAARLLASTEPKYARAQHMLRALEARAGAGPFAFLSWALETPDANGDTGWSRVFARLGPEARDPLEELLQRALKPGAHSAPTLQRFLHEIESDAGQVKRELEAETGAVRVMTVHGAKGLEAPLVILPDATAPANDKPESGLMFDAERGPFMSVRSSDDDAATRAARAEHAERMQSEHWRLLYVAMTRARDRLIVCGAQHGNGKSGEAEESWRLAAEQALVRLGAAHCETPFGEGWRLGAVSHAPAASARATPEGGVPAWAKAPVAPASASASAAPSRAAHAEPALFSPRGDGARRFRRGRLIHGLLERLPDVEAPRRGDAARAWLERQGVTEADARAYTQEALRVIDDAAFAPLFGAESRAEAPIIGQAGGKLVSGVVDRLAVDGDRVLVLDFKTDRPAPSDAAGAPDSYVLQMALYREVLRAVFARKQVVCALLWTEIPRLMELPQERLDAAFERFRNG